MGNQKMSFFQMKSKSEQNVFSFSKRKLEWYWTPLFVFTWFVLFYLVVIPSFHHYPDTMTNKDEAKHPEKFIGQRAETNLLALTRLGPRVVGSAANEQAAVKFLVDRIEDVRKQARLDLYDLEYNIQNATGDYTIFNMVNMYQGIQNVVAKLTPKNSNSTSYLLINSHYDSVPGSSGAGDAGIMIVTMLEVMRVIAKSDKPMTHPIVFLFNGAEENPLQASHAFITQHDWAGNCAALINLDSAGSGGREILFQSGPDHPWLMKYYGEHIEHPYASTIGEELFQNDFIPSDTDFRVFRDYGKIPGFDMAHSLNGYVYHTKYDRFNTIKRGSYQTTGDNVLALTRALANAPELENTAEHAEGHVVFFDVLGWYMVFYTEDDGVIINIVVSVSALISISVSIWQISVNSCLPIKRVLIKFGIIFAIQLLAVSSSICLPILIGLFMDAIGLPLVWFSKSWFTLGLYFCPLFFCLGIFAALFLHRTKEHCLPLSSGVQLFLHSHCIILVVLTLTFTGLSIRSGFIFMIAIFFYTCSVIINLITCLYRKAFWWMVPHCLLQIFPFLFYAYCAYAFYVTFIPMQGRDGPDGNPEIIISGFTALIGVLLSGFIVPLLCMFRKTRLTMLFLPAITIVFIILAATPLGFPYKAETSPQRFYVLHATRTYHNEDMSVRQVQTGYYVMPVDRRSDSIKESLEFKEDTSNLDADCRNELMCGLPLYSARWLGWKNDSFWIPGPAPNMFHVPQMKIVSKYNTTLTHLKYEIEISGPDHMGMFLNPIGGAKLIDWSFNKVPLEENFELPYFVYFSYATDPTPLKFWIEFDRNSLDWSGPSFDIAVIGHLVHHQSYHTDEFNEFLDSLPSWAYASAWMSSYDSYTL